MRKVAALALGSAAFLCFTATAQAKQLTVWCWDPNFNGAIMKEAGARYAKLHPDVTLNIVDFGKTDMQQKLQATLVSGITDSLPDIVLIEDYDAQKYLQSFPGSFEPLSDKIDLKGFAPYKVALATVNGKSYSMPFDSGVTGLFYRSDYFSAAGVTAADMQNLTWDKFIEIGKKVEAKTGKKLLALDTSDSNYIRIMMQSAGKWYFDAAGKLDIEKNEALKAALTVEGKMINANVFKPASGWANWVGAFQSGDVASVIAGVWIVPTIKAQKDQAGKWAVTALPKLDLKGAVDASNLGGSSWYVIASSKEKATAVDFLAQTFGKDADFYQKILVERGAVGSLLSARAGASYDAPDAFFGGDKIWQKFSEWLGKVPSVNYGAFTAEADSATAVQVPEIAKGKSVDKALKDIADQVKAQIQ